MVPFFVAFLLLTPSHTDFKWIAFALFVVASLTDLLDGHIARKYHMITNFGKFMDPLADKLLVTAALSLFVYDGRASVWILFVVILREFTVTGLRLVAAGGGVVIAASMWGKVKTTVQMIMVIVLLLGLPGAFWGVLGLILQVAAGALTVISGVDYLVKNSQVLKD